MTTAINLSTLEEIHFGANTTPEYAAAYGHFTTNNLSSWFFRSVQDNDGKWQEKASFEYGKYSVLVGDWCCLVSDQVVTK